MFIIISNIFRPLSNRIKYNSYIFTGIDLNLFIKRPDGLYERAEETHLQRGIEKDDIEKLAVLSGLEIIKILDSDTEEEVNDNTERIYAVLKKPEI